MDQKKKKSDKLSDRESVVEAIRNGLDWPEILLRTDCQLRKRARHLFAGEPDLFVKLNVDDVYSSIQDKFVEKLRKIRFDLEKNDAELECTVLALISYSVLSVKRDAIRKKPMLSLGTADIPQPVQERHVESKVDSTLHVLTLCVSTLKSGKQKKFIRLLLEDKQLVEIAKFLGQSRSSITQMYQRTRDALKKCLESKGVSIDEI